MEDSHARCMAKFVHYGPAPRYGLPEAGFCVSSFALVQEGEKILVGIARDHPRWPEEWAPNFDVYDEEDRQEEFRLWRIPAAYLYEGEHPDAASERVMRDQLAIQDYKVTSSDIYSFYDPSDWYPGHKHYDLCFVYRVEASLPEETPAWYEQLEMMDISGLSRDDFGSAIGDLTSALGLTKE